ncbi:short-chain dehydrogenase/reductase SDR [Anaeromyxobacter sp. K]|uniref:SDR family NAD(P)-dependent oxidoreductase n=1 Tax=Anaeromyxobacter sp. (strain K) TaxID=447217 RepID=UPI00017BE374|nr:SDR family NAD(P)-dependent oxidoreductase [Anaeromyxobacter sp. K]ACG75121.1 short-chain dehydrogenase/reductase SDR [Anaeromyxobacter sp. K]
MAPPGAPEPLAVVTGASAGIGLALARELSRRGRPVLAVARREDRLRSLAAEAHAAGRAEIHPLALDVAAPGAPERLVEASRRLGGAGLLVNNAGLGQYGRFDRANPARLAAMLRVNCEALVLLSHAFLPELRAAGGGAILNVASAAAFQPTPYTAVYGATKAFVLSFTEGLAEELRGSSVWAGTFCPGPVDTEFGEVAGTGGRFGKPPGMLTAEAAALEAIEQLRDREVVWVPHPIYKLTAAASRLVPRAVLRRVSGRIHRPTEDA